MLLFSRRAAARSLWPNAVKPNCSINGKTVMRGKESKPRPIHAIRLPNASLIRQISGKSFGQPVDSSPHTIAKGKTSGMRLSPHNNFYGPCKGATLRRKALRIAMTFIRTMSLMPSKPNSCYSWPISCYAFKASAPLLSHLTTGFNCKKLKPKNSINKCRT